jgi:rod shape determining protein RodA
MVMRPPARSSRQGVTVDVTLVIASLFAAVVGIVMIYTATKGTLVSQGLSPTYFLKRQAIFVLLGVGCMAAFAFLDYRHLERVAMAVYGVVVFMLLAVLSPVGSHALGSQRWFSLGLLQVQPSEFAVLALIIAVATFCARRDEGLGWVDVVKVLVLGGIPIVLVMVQPDLGTALILTIVLLVMLAAAGLPGRILVLLLLGIGLAILIAVKGGFLHQYQIQRLTSFLHQDSSDPSQQGAIYNLQQAKNAIGSGGLWGAGIGHGAQTNLGYVPEQQTDFIFTAVGEQLGFMGASAVLVLLGVIAWRFLRTAQLARDVLGRLLCAGIFVFFAFSVFQNAGMTMGIMPITGIPLPFLSYGGSAALVFFMCVGVSLSVYARRGDAHRREPQRVRAMERVT